MMAGPGRTAKESSVEGNAETTINDDWPWVLARDEPHRETWVVGEYGVDPNEDGVVPSRR